MTQLSKVIKVHSGYASAVDLRLEFSDQEKNRGRMIRYMPTSAHREAFEKLSNVLKPKDKRVYLLTGSYGTGKTHLTLMVANYLSHTVDSPELKSFLEHYRELDPVAAEKLHNLRANGRYLVAICDYETKDDFEEIILRAIANAFKREGFEGELDTHYKEAVRRIQRWEKDEEEGTSRMDFFSVFEEELQDKYPEYTINRLINDLNQYKEDSLRIFKDVHKSIMGIDFNYEKSNLNDILTDILSSHKFKERFKGMAILFDEFGYTLQNQRLSVEIFQGFAQLCTQGAPDCAPMLFLATGHKSFGNYADGWSKQDFRKVSDRIDEIDLKPEGIEDVIASIVQPKKESQEWKNDVTTREAVFSSLLKDSKRLSLFKHLSAPQIKTKIIENIFPMHPLATHCLLRMSVDVGSNNRSVFTFFTGEFGEEEGSFPWYINNEPILKNNLLNLYTPNLLVKFFKSSLHTHNRELRDSIKRLLQDYESTLREYNKTISSELIEVDDTENIINTMLVYELAAIPTTLENIVYGLYSQQSSLKNTVFKRLQELCKLKVLFYNKQAQTYEFKKINAVDFEDLIEEYKDDRGNQIDEITEQLVEVVPLSKDDVFVEAKHYNQTYGEDKRFIRKIAKPADLSQPEFYSKLNDDMKTENDWKNSYEGIAVYALCQTKEEIDKAKTYVQTNPSKHIVIYIPNEPIKVTELLMNVKAIEGIRRSEDYGNYQTQDKSRINELLGDERRETGYKGELVQTRKKLFDGKSGAWYGIGGNFIKANPSTEFEVVNSVMESLFSKRNKYNWEDLNHSHKAKPRKNIALKDATEAILDYRSPIKVDTNYGNDRGLIKYVDKLAKNYGVFVQVNRDGSYIYYRTENNPNNYQDQFKALADMIETVQRLQSADELSIQKFISIYTAPPYGLGPISVIFNLSIVLRVFGDTLRVKKDRTSLGDLVVRDYDVLYGLVSGEGYPNAFFIHKDISQSERDYLKKIGTLFSSEVATVDKQWSVSEVWQVMNEWWNGLNSIQRSKDIHKEMSKAETVAFVEEFNELNSKDPYSFLLHELQTKLGYEVDHAITEDLIKKVLLTLQALKDEIENTKGNIEQDIMKEVAHEFNAEGTTYDDVKDAVINWFNTLDNVQKNLLATFQSNDSKPLIRHFQSLTDVTKTFFEEIPLSYGLQKISEWDKNKKEDYLLKLRNGKKTIEYNRVKVEVPHWSAKGNVIEQTEENSSVIITYKGNLDLELNTKGTGYTIFITDNNEDPTQPSSQRMEEREQVIIPIRSINQTIKFVAKDTEGNYSQTVTINFYDEDKKYEVTAHISTINEPSVKILLPKDEESLAVTVRSLLRTVLESNSLERGQIERVLTNVLAELKEGNDK